MYWSSIYTDRKLLQSLIQMSGRLRELENKGKYQSAIHESGRGRYRELLTAF